MTLSISKISSQNCEKLTKNHTKTLILTTLDILQLKKLVIVKTFTVLILSIYLLIMRKDISKKKGE